MADSNFDKWFRNWWDEDWSWEGLAKKSWKGGGQGSTIQDYWRSEENALVGFAGKRWTQFHFPLHDLDGNPSEKAAWIEIQCGEFQEAIFVRLRRTERVSIDSEGKLRGNDKRAQLQGIVFPRSIDFSALKAEMNVDFSFACFQDETNFGGITFGPKTGFEGAFLGDYAWFHSVRFLNWVHFENARFGQLAVFDNVAFGSDLQFQNAILGDHAQFLHATFGINAQFKNGIFGEGATFEAASFGNNACFDGATFEHGASFQNSHLGDSVTFNGVVFNGYANFSSLASPQGSAPDGYNQFLYITFNEATFKDIVRFTNREFRDATRFSRVKFLSLPDFHNTKLHQDTDFSEADFLGVEELRKQFRRAVVGKKWWPPKEFWQNRRDHLTLRNKHAAALERAYRTLKLAMEGIRSRSEETMFHALELEARRLRRDIPFSERAIASLYKWSSAYGESISAPAISWLIVQVFFGGIYWAISSSFASSNDAALTRFVMEQNVRPFSIWTTRYFELLPRDSWVCKILEYENFPYFEILVSLQSVASLSLIFLFLLSIRRRFRMN